MASRVGAGIVILGAVALAVVATAAGSALSDAQAGTTVEFGGEPERSLTNGSTVVIPVTVDGANRSIGSFELDFTMADSDIARISNVSIVGNGSMTTVRVAENGSRATAAAIGHDGSDESDRLVDVTVTAVGTGTTRLNLSVDSLADPEGRPYELQQGSTVRFSISSEASADTVSPSDGTATDSSPSGQGDSSGSLPVVIFVVLATFVGGGYVVYRFR